MISWHKTLKSVWNTLLILEILLFLIFFLFQFIAYTYPSFSGSYLFKLFDFGLEVNVPTFFSAFLFILLAISTWFCGVFDKYKGLTKKEYLPWILLSILLLFLSLDEFAQIHEQLTDPIRQFLGVGGFLYFAWIIPYAIALLLLAFYFIPFILRLSRKTKLLILTGASVFVFGAIGFEMLGASLYATGASGSISYTIVSSLEEFFEITGILIALKGLFNEILLRV